MYKCIVGASIIVLSGCVSDPAVTAVTNTGGDGSQDGAVLTGVIVRDMTIVTHDGAIPDMAVGMNIVPDMTPVPPALPAEYECIHKACPDSSAFYSGTMRCDQVNDLYCETSNGYPFQQWRGGDTAQGKQPGPCKTNADCGDDSSPASTCSLIAGATWGRCCPPHATCSFTN